MADTEPRVITLGITGASGAMLAQTALRLLEAEPRVARIHLVVTEAGQRLLTEELSIVPREPKQLPELLLGKAPSKTELLPNKDIGASIASGSASVDSMLVLPCSAGTLASIANGTSEDLLCRAADVCLKEGRTLVLCLRETPLNRVHIENMLRAQQAGVVIMPVVPAFYHQPKTLDDVITQYVCRVLARIGLFQQEQYRWRGSAAARNARA